jgi:hypothetical protein
MFLFLFSITGSSMLWWAVGLGAVVLVLYYLMWKDADPSSLKPSDFKWNPDNLGTSPANASTKRLILFDPCSSLVCTFHAVHAEEKQEVPTREKIAVVGAGFCGLGIAGAFTVNPSSFLRNHNTFGLLFVHQPTTWRVGPPPSFSQRHGIPYDVLEMDNDVGGNWYHGVYETVHIISSRKTTEYKDVPMPADWPDFPSADQVLTYASPATHSPGVECAPDQSTCALYARAGTSARTPSAIRSSHTASSTQKVGGPVAALWCC